MGREFVCLEILDSSTSTCPPRLPDDSLNPFALFEPRQVATMGGVSVRDVDVSVPLHLIDRCSLWWMSSFLEAWAGGHMDIVMRWNGIWQLPCWNSGCGFGLDGLLARRDAIEGSVCASVRT